MRLTHIDAPSLCLKPLVIYCILALKQNFSDVAVGNPKWSSPYLAGPNPFYDEAIVLKDIENLYKAPGVSEDGDAGVGYGQV